MKKSFSKKLVSALIITAMLFIPQSLGVAVVNVPSNSYDSSTLLIKLNREISLFSSDPAEGLYGCESLESLFAMEPGSGGEVSLMSYEPRAEWVLAELEEGIDPLLAMAALESDERVLATMLNYDLELFDTEYELNTSSTQWYLEEAGLSAAQTMLTSYGLDAAGADDIIVAVIDTGVAYEHPDLAACIWTNPGEIADDGVDNDGNGYVDDIRGWNFADSSGKNDPMDSDGHGTFVSGIIAAQGNTITGVAPNVKIMPIKVIGETGSVANLLNAIEYACQNGADILNMSLGVTVVNNTSVNAYHETKAFYDIVQTYKDTALLVAAAGNKESAVEGSAAHAWPNNAIAGYSSYCVTYPAALDGVIGVMASDRTPDANGDMLATYSRWDPYPGTAPEYDIIAPGTSIYSTRYIPSSGTYTYGSGNGTSFASPFVCGLAALLLTDYQGTANENAAMVRQALIESAIPVQGFTYTYSGTEYQFYYPSVNLEAALKYATADLNNDGIMDESDIDILNQAVHAFRGDSSYLPAGDHNNDGIINTKDLAQHLRNSSLE